MPSHIHDPNDTSTTFDSLVQGYLEELFSDSPWTATHLGYPGMDDRSSDLSAGAITAREARADRWLERFSALGDERLSFDQRIDRDLVCSVLRGQQIRRDWQEWRRNPEHYLFPALVGVFLLFLRRPLPEPELAEAATTRLAAVPGLLAAGRANLDPELAAPVFVQRALSQCQAGESYIRDLVPAELRDDSSRGRVAESCAVAAEALASFGSYLSDLAEQATGDWAIGEGRYSALLQEVELLPDDAGGLHARGRVAWAELDAEMTELARAVNPDQANWRETVSDCGDFRPQTPDEMRGAYATETTRARAFLVEHDLVSMPEGESCEAVPSPPFLRPVLAVASYIQPPFFADGPTRNGRLNVPYPPEGATPEEVAKRLANNGYHTIPTMTAHEAYPGHHWHLATMQAASPLRRMHRSPYFSEGWALYAERLMRENGYFATPRDELMHLNARIFRAARIVVDTALHSGEMTFDQAVAHMQREAGLTEPVARVEVGRYCSWPTQAAGYLTGCLEIERLRDRWREEERGDLRGFHDTLAATGCLPVALAEKALFEPEGSGE